MSNNSAGVYVREFDESQVVSGTSTSIGAILGRANKGPVGVRKLITSVKQFIDVYGKPDASMGFMHHSALAFLNEANRLYVTRVAPGALFGGSRHYIGGSNLSAAGAWSTGQADPTSYSFASSDLFILHAIDPGLWNQELSVTVYPDTVSNDNHFYVDVYTAGVGSPVERFRVTLDMEVDGNGVQLNIMQHINRRSKYIRVEQNLAQAAFASNPSGVFINTLSTVTFAGGINGTAPTTGNFVNAWDLYKDVEKVDVNILINAGLAIPAIQLKMDAIATSRMDSVAILDVPSTEQEVEAAVDYRRTTLNLNSNYSALYSCDLYVLDDYSSRRLYVPPSGYVAAVYAATDRDAATWFAPAGLQRGKLPVLGAAQIYNQGDRDILDANQINAIRVLAGVGIVVWGAETLQSKRSALSNVNVRRLMNFIEKSLSLTALYSVFNPNDPILRQRLVEIATRFLEPIKNAQGVYNYGVVCDESNNPPEVTATGDLVMDVFIDPVLPAKRILLTATINKTGAKFTAA